MFIIFIEAEIINQTFKKLKNLGYLYENAESSAFTVIALSTISIELCTILLTIQKIDTKVY